jgi:Cyclin, N-terminal domain/Cyclin, C-terminal domain
MTNVDESINSVLVDTLSTLLVMRQQEEAGYLCFDYLHQAYPEPTVPTGPLNRIDVDCRNKMAAWCYQVVDFCKFDRETVSIAMNYLDRYLMSSTGSEALNDRKVFQLAAMTSLYTAVKIHEPEAMDPKLVSNLSRGTYNKEEIEAMESSILGALQWRMNPPTSMSFIRLFLDLIPQDVMDVSVRNTVSDIAKYQTELAVRDFNFIATKASTIAFCAVINSFESLNMDVKVLSHIAYILSSSIGLDEPEDALLEIQNYLYQAVLQHPGLSACFSSAPALTRPNKASRSTSIDVSPQSISAIR